MNFFFLMSDFRSNPNQRFLLASIVLGSRKIRIADFGCADMKFASHLYSEVSQTDELKGLTFNIVGFDFTSDDIQVTYS
jgi:hypothetical protein